MRPEHGVARATGHSQVVGTKTRDMLRTCELHWKPWCIVLVNFLILLDASAGLWAKDISVNTSVRILESFGDPNRVVARPLVQLAADELGSSFGIYSYGGSADCGALVRRSPSSTVVRGGGL